MEQILANKYMQIAQKAYKENNILLAKSNFERIVELDESANTLHFGITPYFALSLIYATFEEWSNCEKITEKGLIIEPNNTILLNHMGVAICSQSNDRILNGLFYFKKGFDLGDEKNCGRNYLYWYKQISK